MKNALDAAKLAARSAEDCERRWAELKPADDAAAEYRVLLDALHVCPDDHELEYDAGCAALELGDAPRAGEGERRILESI